MARPYTERRGKPDNPYPWRVRWPLPPDSSGVVHWDSASGFPDSDTAMEYGYEQMLAVKNGTWIDPRKAATPFGEYAERWLATHKRSLATNDSRAYLLSAVIVPRWAKTTLGDLNWDEIREWANALVLPRNTVNQAVSLMSTMLTSAVDTKMIGSNPLAGRRRNSGVKRPANLDPKTVPWPRPEQAAAIAARQKRDDGILTLLQVFAGPRINELLALHRSASFAERTDIVGGRPWTRRVLLVTRDEGSLEEVEYTAVDKSGAERIRRKLVAAPPKNRFSVREVDLPPFLKDLLDVQSAAHTHPHLFATATGAFQHYSNYDKRLKRAAEGWPESPPRRGTSGRPGAEPIVMGLSSHGNRHGHATMMADAGLPEVLRRYILGQKIPGMAGVYEHPTPEMRLRRVRMLEEIWWSPGVADAYLAGEHAVPLVRRLVLPKSLIIPTSLPKQGTRPRKAMVKRVQPPVL